MNEISREEWLAERQNYLGASDCAAVLGADPRRGALAVYEAKVTGHSTQDNKWMRYGRDVEAAIANMYSEETDRVVEDLGATTISVHKDIPWLGATLDRVTWKDSNTLGGPLELKSIDPYGAKIRADEFKEEPPLQYQIQLQIQMACRGSHWGSLAGLFPGYQLAYKDWEFDERFITAAFPILEEFWDRVQRKDPPDPDTLPNTLDVVKRFYGSEDGTTVEIDPEVVHLVDEWEKAKADARDAGKVAKSLETQLRGVMKEATFGRLSDGTMLTLKTTHRKAYQAKASTFRTLRRVLIK